jgi:Protein of unknown function (DUF3617)
MNLKWVLVALSALVCAGLGAAHAADMVKPGGWEYTTTMQMPNMPQLPPGVQLPPNVHMQSGPGGMTVTSTHCVTASDPIAGLNRPHGPANAGMQCRNDRMDRNGNTVSWAGTCTMPDGGTVHSVGTAHYDGDRMEANVKTQTSAPQGGAPMETSLHVTGRYLGPCNRQ